MFLEKNQFCTWKKLQHILDVGSGLGFLCVLVHSMCFKSARLCSKLVAQYFPFPRDSSRNDSLFILSQRTKRSFSQNSQTSRAEMAWHLTDWIKLNTKVNIKTRCYHVCVWLPGRCYAVGVLNVFNTLLCGCTSSVF